MKIEFGELGMPVFTGRDRGRRARVLLGLDAADAANEIVRVIVPNEVYSITSSYFLGLFGDSVRSLGRDGFREKYIWEAPAHVEEKLDDWLARALREKHSVLRGVGDV